MKTVAKYNTFKGISTLLTAGTPFISLLSCSELFVHRSETAISAAGVFAMLFAILFFKDKLLENFAICHFCNRIVGDKHDKVDYISVANCIWCHNCCDRRRCGHVS